MTNILDGVVPSLLQGVSQQIPRERLPGQLIQKHNQDEEAANNERTQRRIEEWNKSAEAIEDAQQRAHEAIILPVS